MYTGAAMGRTRGIGISILSLVWIATTVQAQFELTRNREFALEQNPALRELARLTGTNITIVLDGQGGTAVVSENVFVTFDCGSWLRRFPGGSVGWFVTELDTITGEQGERRAIFDPFDPSVQLTSLRQSLSGMFNEILDVAGTVIAPGAESTTSAIYECQVCVGRGTPFEDCHSASVELWGLGQPPNLDSAEPNEGRIEGITSFDAYKIGADICIEDPPDGPSSPNIIRIFCDDLHGVPSEDQPISFPVPARTWTKIDDDGSETILYEANSRALFSVGSEAITDEFRNEFPALAGNDTLLRIGPQLGTIAFELFNYIGSDAMRVESFNEIFGTWTCGLNNSFAAQKATTVVRRCGDRPLIENKPPGAPLTVIVDSGDEVLIGCNACVRQLPQGQEKVNLKCNITEGTPPVSFMWGEIIDANTTEYISDEMGGPLFQELTAPGSYACMVDNLDGSDMKVSDLFVIPRVELTVEINSTNGRDVGTGCGRLRIEVDADVCAFLGEGVDFDCSLAGDSEVAVSLVTSNGTVLGQGLSISSVTPDNQGVYMCLFNDSDCGAVEETFTFNVYDPARIDRSCQLPADHGPTGIDDVVGAGRDDADIVVGGQDVALYCPATGIDDPTTTWRRIYRDSRGRTREQRIRPDGVMFFIENGDCDGVASTVLVIRDFGSDQEGTYVCRSKNAAGVDSGLVSLRRDEEIGTWYTGEFSTECSLPCHRGEQVRVVECRSNYGDRLLPESVCEADDRQKPPTTQRCTDLGPCFDTPFWSFGAWSGCTLGCAGGFRWRKVFCIVPRTREIVDDYQCNDYIRPHQFDLCKYRCCLRDLFPKQCQSGTRRCGDPSYAYNCCWTCKLTAADRPPH